MLGSPHALDPEVRHAAEGSRRELLFRWGPWYLLGLSALIAAGTADTFMDDAERRTAMVLVAAGLLLQLVWDRVRRRLPAHSAAAQAYYVVRWALAFVLTMLNPFFAIYAVIGYFDAGHLLPGWRAYAGLVASAVIMAGSQSGGLPPQDVTGWGAFGVLFGLHVSLVLVFSHLEGKDIERRLETEETIAALERANLALADALDENAALHAQLLIQAREAGIDDERRRLAAEIHDTIAQGLTGIVTQLEASANAADPGTARAHVDRASALARSSLREARRSVRNLAPGPLEHDALPEALKRVVDDWTATAGVPATFTVTGIVQPLHDEIGGTLLRIAQEALANARRHADAGRVGVTLSYMDDEVALDVRDDGRGFDFFKVDNDCYGLSGMRVRAERLAGTLGVESEPGAGTAVSARVPLVRDA